VNTALAIAADPGRIARAFALAVVAGRQAFRYGTGRAQIAASASARSTESLRAKASSPLTGFLNEESR